MHVFVPMLAKNMCDICLILDQVPMQFELYLLFSPRPVCYSLQC